jgi:uncharacterized membrane protein
MLRGTRTQYLRRRQYLSVWIWVPFAFCLCAIPVALSTGWQRILWAFIMGSLYIFVLLHIISRLTDKQWYKQMAESGLKANQRGADAVYMPGLYRPKAIHFAKRLFSKRKSD